MTWQSSTRTPLPRPIDVLLVDDHRIVREGIRAVLDADDDICVVADVGTLADAHRAVAGHSPHIMLLDHQLPDGDGVSACAGLLERQPTLKIVVLTLFDSAELARRALATGAFGFLVKETDPQELRDTLHAVMAGRRVIGRGTRGPAFELSERELEVLRLLAEGHSNGRIADHLGVSLHSVRTYVSRVMAKLGAKNRTDAAVIAVATGLAQRTN